MNRMRKLIKLLLPLLIALTMAVPVYAETEDTADPSVADYGVAAPVMDEAGVLSEDETETLSVRLEELSEKLQMDVAIVTVESLDGRSAMEYADDYYDVSGYGYGSDRDGVMLLLAMEERDWWITTRGYGTDAFTDAGIYYIGEKITGEFGDGNYAQAFGHYADLCEDFVVQARNGEPYDTGHLPKEKLSSVWIFGDLGIGMIFSLILGLITKSKLKTVRKKETAADYTVPGSVSMYMNSDQLVNQYVTQKHIQKSSGSSGSSEHTSSSGATHGGGGGKF